MKQIPIYIVVVFVSWLAGKIFPLPLGAENLFRYLVAPLGGVGGYAAGTFWKSSSRGILKLIFVIISGLLCSLIYIFLHYKLPSPTLIWFFIEAFLFIVPFFCFFFLCACAGLALWKK
jgi:hypothetical protein